MLHVARGYSLRETVVRAKLAKWTDISDVALLKRLRNSEEWLRCLCIELLQENVAYRLEGSPSRTIRIVDGNDRQKVFMKFSEFFICCQFSTRKFASGSPRNDDRQRDGPTACPFLSLLGAHFVSPKSLAARS